jgi:superfamily II DNA or RNA helicase
MPANFIDDRETCDLASPHDAQPLPSAVGAGGDVVVRGGRWRVEATIAHADCHELHLSSHATRERRVLLWPFDRPVAAEQGLRLRRVRLQTWAAAVGRAVAGAVEPLTPRARDVAVAILPYQLDPAVAMAAGAPRVLLADEVGLGKTIQAGWIVADLVAREHAPRVLIAVPAGLREQWASELMAAFRLDTLLVNARWLRVRIADIPAEVSPWAAPEIYVASLDFIKRPDIAASLAAHVWDLLIVDEAHTATWPTDRHAALAALAARARRVVTITATPYSGDVPSFASLARLGDAALEPPPLMFRRAREDVGDARRRRHRFAAVRITAAESRLQRLLEKYCGDVWREAPADVEGARLAVTVLRKRALSSPAAAQRSLARRLDLLRDGVTAPARQLTLFDEDDLADDDLPAGALATPGLADAALEHRRLRALVDAAAAAIGIDSKQRCLLRFLDRVKTESVIVFTEYRDTLLHLASRLPASLHMHGGMTAAERAGVQAAFNEHGGILLATDAAAEGLNLQRRCRIVVNYELPWNPARLEQRIGRVDRIGQARTVHAITLVARDTAEDLVIANLARRLTLIVASLGDKDRLGAFLTDARTAGLVIGGVPIDDPADGTGPPASFVERAPATGAEAMLAATQLRLARGARGARDARSAQGARSAVSDASHVVVSTLRSTPDLPSGFVIAFRCEAVTVDGEVAAARVILLHLAAGLSRPASHAAARSAALGAIAAGPDVERLVPDLAGWFADVRRRHEATVDRRRGREAAMRDRPVTSGAVQPGLFDRRAIRAAEALSDADHAIRDEHQRRIDATDRSRSLTLACRPAAVLLVWR